MSSDIKCIGGRMTYKRCTAKLQKENEKLYEDFKIHGWLDLMSEHGARPTRMV